MIVAKPVIPNQYWILREDDRKIGNIELGPNGVSVKINNQTRSFKSLKTLKKGVNISFENISWHREKSHGNEIYGYPTTGQAHNAVYDVKHQVPLWTQEPRSRSWFAAGWYRVRQGRRWTTVLCPKLITLERYEYRGPFSTQQEAEQA
jgi:hypothetical protein